MKAVVLALTLAITVGSLGSFGCVVRSHDHGRRHSNARARECPPAHHWEDGRCVHNGRARGHQKHKRR